MNRPPLEVADVVRAAGPAFIDRCLSCFDRHHLKVLNAIQRCRTAALGGHVDECSRCGLRTISYNSCRNRHCPKCQANARHRWLEARRAELLPTRYVHVVFTLPHELAPTFGFGGPTYTEPACRNIPSAQSGIAETSYRGNREQLR